MGGELHVHHFYRLDAQLTSAIATAQTHAVARLCTEILALFGVYRQTGGFLGDARVVGIVMNAITTARLPAAEQELRRLFADYRAATTGMLDDQVVGVMMYQYCSASQFAKCVDLYGDLVSSGAKPRPHVTLVAMDCMTRLAVNLVPENSMEPPDRAYAILAQVEKAFERCITDHADARSFAGLVGELLRALTVRLWLETRGVDTAHFVDSFAALLQQPGPVTPLAIERRQQTVQVAGAALQAFVDAGGDAGGAPLLEALISLAMLVEFNEVLPLRTFSEHVHALSATRRLFPVFANEVSLYIHLSALTTISFDEYDARRRSGQYPSFYSALEKAIQSFPSRVAAREIVETGRVGLIVQFASLLSRMRMGRALASELAGVFDTTPALLDSIQGTALLGGLGAELGSAAVDHARAAVAAWLGDWPAASKYIRSARFRLESVRSTMTYGGREELRATTAAADRIMQANVMLFAHQAEVDGNEALRWEALALDEERRARDVAFDLWRRRNQPPPARGPVPPLDPDEADLARMFPVCPGSSPRLRTARAAAHKSVLENENRDAFDYVSDYEELYASRIRFALVEVGDATYVSLGVHDDEIRVFIAQGGRVTSLLRDGRAVEPLRQLKSSIDRAMRAPRKREDVDAWRFANTLFEESLAAAATALGWDEILAHASKGEGPIRVVLSAEGALHGIPFHALPSKRMVELTYALGLRALLLLAMRWDAAPITSDILYVGNSGDAQAPLDLSSEVGALADVARRRNLRFAAFGTTAPRAEPDAFLTYAPHARLVVLAGHGIVDARNPGSCGIELAGQPLTADQIVAAGPLLRSIRMLVLSTCSVARVFERYGEAMGMIAALHSAGAASIVGGLWPIYDDVAARFTARLVEAAADALFVRDPKAGELAASYQRALRALREDFPGQPLLWSAFAYFGLP